MTQTVVSTDQVWRPLKVGGGGYVTKCDVAADGTIMVGTDTYGGYIRRPGDATWTQYMTAYSLPSDEVYYAHGDGLSSRGVYDCRIAPTNNDVMYMVCSERPFRSDDAGETWTRIDNGWPAKSDSQMDPDAKTVFPFSRMTGPFMAIDPLNEDVVYLGNGKRLYRTLDGGANWAACTGISDATDIWPGVSGLVIDKSSTTAGSGVTRKSTVMVWVYGRGWYRSTDGGDSFSLLGIEGPGYPDNPSAVSGTSGTYRIFNAECNDAGIILACDGENVWRYTGGVWDNVGGLNAWYALFDPFDQDRVIYVTDDCSLTECLDITAATPTWGTKYNGSSIKDGMESPWVAVSGEEVYMSAGQAKMSMTTQNRIIQTQGCGVWYADIAPGFTAVPWKNYTAGIENLVGIQIRKFAGNKHIYCLCYDRALFTSGNPEAYASKSNTPFIINTANYGLRWGACAAAPDDNSDMILALVQNGRVRSGISTDQGRTWEDFPDMPPQYLTLIASYDSISTVSGSPTVTISGVTHGLATNDWTAFTRAQAVGGVSLQGKKYQVTVTNSTTFTITYESNASSTVNLGGKNVLFTPRYTNGSNPAFTGVTDRFSCVDGSDLVTFNIPANSEASNTTVGTRWYFYGTSTIGGLDIEGEQVAVETISGGFKFRPGGTANATVAAGGGSNVCFYSDWPKGTVAPSTQVVCSTETNWIMVGGSRRLPPYYTTDGGVTWTESTFPSELSIGGWSFSYYQMRNCIDSDPNVPGTFYAFHSAGGTFRSTDGGANFTLMNSDDFSSHSTGNWHAQLACVPGHAGHLFWSCGSIGGTPSTSVEGRAMFSTNGGATWEFLGVATLGGSDPGTGEIAEVNWISVGAVKPGSSYPTIWLSGWINGVYGIYYCTDASPTTTGKWTWNSVEAHPDGWMDFITGLQADPDVWHTCYVSLGGSGFKYTTQTDLTKRDFDIAT